MLSLVGSVGSLASTGVGHLIGHLAYHFSGVPGVGAALVDMAPYSDLDGSGSVGAIPGESLGL